MAQAETIIIAAVAAATPTITGLIGIVLQQQNARDMRSELRTEVSGFRSELRSEVAGLRSEIAGLRSELRAESGAVRADMVSLRTQIHADLLMKHERVART